MQILRGREAGLEVHTVSYATVRKIVRRDERKYAGIFYSVPRCRSSKGMFLVFIHRRNIYIYLFIISLNKLLRYINALNDNNGSELMINGIRTAFRT